MCKSFDKPFMTHDQLVCKLIDENKLIIHNRDYAVAALRSLSYYNLINGYQECFCDPQTGQYADGTTIEYLCKFHYFDKSMQSVFLKYCTYIEDTFKNHLAYVLAKDFGEDMNLYLDPKNYVRSYQSSGRTRSIEPTLENLWYITKRKCLRPPTSHYLKKHNHVPPWILFKNANFTDVIDLYTFLKSPQKDQICNLMFGSTPLTINDQKNFLKTAINMIRKYRNTIAHSLKYITFRMNVKERHKATLLDKCIPKALWNWSDVRQDNRSLNDVFGFFLSIFMLLDNRDLIESYLREIHLLITIDAIDSDHLQTTPLFTKYAQVTGLPSDLADRISLLIEQLT